MTAEALADALRPWLRPEHGPAFEAALAWLWPRCRTEEERLLAPALLLLLAPLNALATPCRPVKGSVVNFQLTFSRATAAGPERVRLTVRASAAGVQAFRRSGVQEGVPQQPRAGAPSTPAPILELWLDTAALAADPFGSAAQVLCALIALGSDLPAGCP